MLNLEPFRVLASDLAALLEQEKPPRIAIVRLRWDRSPQARPVTLAAVRAALTRQLERALRGHEMRIREIPPSHLRRLR